MTTLQEVLPCPFCGKQHTLQVISGQELMDENQEFWQHSESFGVVCDASTPDGKGGCGAMGGFRPTEDEAIEAWNTRTALAQQGEQQGWKWVPVEPTPEMLKAPPNAWEADAKITYAAMLAAAPAPQAQHSAPRIRAMFECIGSRVVGLTEAPIKRVDHEDDDSFTVVIDHWPDMGLATAAPAPVEQRCTYCDGTGDVHSIDGEWRGTCHCATAPAPQAQEPTAWRTEALKWIRRKAEDQRATNEQNPRHAEAYPSWGERVRNWHWLADELELEQNSTSFGLDPYQEPAPQPASELVANFIVSAVVIKDTRTGFDTQHKLYPVSAANSDEATGKALSLVTNDFPEHRLHTMCFIQTAPAPHPAQPLLAHEVLKLNALWNKSSVKDSAIADQLAVCRALAESEDDMELTDAQILTLWEETYVQRGWTGIEFARATERAHGIGVKQ